MRDLRRAGVIGAFVLLMAMLPQTAWAAAPPNDDFDTATVISTLPYSQPGQQSEATAAADDPTQCNGSGGTIWYGYTSPTAVELEASTQESDYDTVVGVYTGSRGALTLLECDDDSGPGYTSRARFNVAAGQTVHFMVTGYGADVGSLRFNLDVAPPPLEIDMDITPTGVLNSTSGEAVVRGIIACSRNMDLYMDVGARQGSSGARGYRSLSVQCTTETQLWFASIPSDPAFERGTLLMVIDVYSNDGSFYYEATIDLREVCSIVGTPENDTLRGFPGDDRICGLAGNDEINGRGGNDRLVGGPGADQLFGAEGDDVLIGGPGVGRNVLNGGPGRDQCKPASRRDVKKSCEK